MMVNIHDFTHNTIERRTSRAVKWVHSYVMYVERRCSYVDFEVDPSILAVFARIKYKCEAFSMLTASVPRGQGEQSSTYIFCEQLVHGWIQTAVYFMGNYRLKHMQQSYSWREGESKKKKLPINWRISCSKKMLVFLSFKFVFFQLRLWINKIYIQEIMKLSTYPFIQPVVTFSAF